MIDTAKRVVVFALFAGCFLSSSLSVFARPPGKGRLKVFILAGQNFIRDIRKDLRVPGLPFVIAETGMHGLKEKHPRALSLMRAQAAVAAYKEFKGNVGFVGTKAFHRTKDVSPSGQSYHWNHNAETHLLIGDAMGKKMLQLLKRRAD